MQLVLVSGQQLFSHSLLFFFAKKENDRENRRKRGVASHFHECHQSRICATIKIRIMSFVTSRRKDRAPRNFDRKLYCFVDTINHFDNLNLSSFCDCAIQWTVPQSLATLALVERRSNGRFLPYRKRCQVCD
jgi:hypothetical protein